MNKDFNSIMNDDGDELIGHLYLTRNYQKFRKHGLNRRVHNDTKQYKDLLKSIKEHGQLMPILVDHNFQVIDGQHRLDICEDLGIAVKFMQIIKEYTIHDIQNMQKTQQWNIVDYIDSEIAKGNKDYEKILKYHDKYQFSHSIIASVLSGVKYYKKQHCVQGKVIVTPENEKDAVIIFEKLAEIQEVIGMMNEKLFIVFYNFFQLQHYSHERMLKQLKHFPVLFKKDGCRWGMSKYEMVDFIDKVYNYGVTVKEKVQLADKYKI